jgi:multicomponent Na+:H+ antiporter subunit D
VFLHAGIKFPWFVFFQKDSGLRPPEPPWNMRLAMGLFAFLCIALGLAYQPLYALLPYPVDYAPYTAWHVIAQLQLLLFSGLAFFVMLGWLRRTLTITLDVDWLYRRLFPAIGRTTGAALGGILKAVDALGSPVWARLESGARQLYGPLGLFARTWPSGAMALGVMLSLLAFLLAYYVS